MSEYLQKAVQYVRNTGRVPLRTDWFDEDNEPVGPGLRAQLLEAGWITVADDGIRLTETAP